MSIASAPPGVAVNGIALELQPRGPLDARRSPCGRRPPWPRGRAPGWSGARSRRAGRCRGRRRGRRRRALGDGAAGRAGRPAPAPGCAPPAPCLERSVGERSRSSTRQVAHVAVGHHHLRRHRAVALEQRVGEASPGPSRRSSPLPSVSPFLATSETGTPAIVLARLQRAHHHVQRVRAGVGGQRHVGEDDPAARLRRRRCPRRTCRRGRARPRRRAP